MGGMFDASTESICGAVGSLLEKAGPRITRPPKPPDPTPDPPSKEPEIHMPQRHAKAGDKWHSGFHGSQASTFKRMQEITGKIEERGYRQVATMWIPIAKNDALKVTLYRDPEGEVFMVGVLHQRRGQGRWNSFYLFGHRMPDEFVPQGMIGAAPRFQEDWEAKQHVMRLPGRR